MAAELTEKGKNDWVIAVCMIVFFLIIACSSLIKSDVACGIGCWVSGGRMDGAEDGVCYCTIRQAPVDGRPKRL